MAKTTVGLFDDVDEAERTVEELTGAGIPRDQISVVVNREKCAPSLGPVESVEGGPGTGEGIAIGATAGFAAGLLAMLIPGVGWVLAAGPLAAGLTGAGVGAVAGGLIGRMKEQGIPEDEAGCFCEAVRQGGVLVSVSAEDEKVDAAAEIIGNHRTVDLDECVAEWRKVGWSGFDPKAEAPPGERKLALPFDPSSVKVGKRRQRRTVRSYVRVR